MRVIRVYSQAIDPYVEAPIRSGTPLGIATFPIPFRPLSTAYSENLTDISACLVRGPIIDIHQKEPREVHVPQQRNAWFVYVYLQNFLANV